MKRFQYISFLAILSMAIVSFSSCFQYPEGPIFTMQLPDERLKGSWLITGFTDASGNDLMSEHQNQTLVADYSHGGDRSWAEFKNNQLDRSGTYLFASHSDNIIVTFDFYDGSQKTPVQYFYTIRKLTDKEFKYIDDQGNTLTLRKY
jgi:hypothetical protein